MKTDATPEVVYGILLSKYYDEIDNSETKEKLEGLVEEISERGYDFNEIEKLSGIKEKRKYFFPGFVSKNRLYSDLLKENEYKESMKRIRLNQLKKEVEEMDYLKSSVKTLKSNSE